MRYGFGVDIFGPNIKFGFFDENGNLLDKWKTATPMMDGGSQILPAVADEIAVYMGWHQLQEDDIIGIGVGIPGPVNGSGVVNKCVNFGWGIFNIDRTLSGLTGLKVKASNIANLSALGECWKGSGTDNMVFLAMNTGLGGAIVCDGRLINGACGGGGELGHFIINRFEKEPCTCGNCGCAEQYCSPTGILRVARRRLAESKTPSVLRQRPIFDHKAVIDAAVNGDRVAREAMNQVCKYTGQLLANVCSVTNPDTIVLGGDFRKMGKYVLEEIAKYFHKFVFHANANARFVYAALDTDACIHGAFKLALDSFGE